MVEEHETYKQRENEKYEILEQRLRKTQEILRDTTKEFLTERKNQREKEREWLQDRDKLMHRLDKAHDKIGKFSENISFSRTNSNGTHRDEK